MDASPGMVIARMTGFVALGFAAVVVGVRLLAQANRTRRFPELALGTHMLLLMLGYAAEFAGIELAGSLGGATVLLRGFGNLCYAASILVILFFNWRVFRPGSRWAALLTGLCVVGLGVGLAGESITGRFDFAPARFAAPWFWLAFVPRVVCMGWSSGEAFHEHGLARRRQRLGLSEPLVVNRLLLWGLASLSECLIYAMVMTAILRGAPSAFLNGPEALVISALGACAAATILLAFLPPKAYHRWLTMDDRAHR
jgi:hypothetical protein